MDGGAPSALTRTSKSTSNSLTDGGIDLDAEPQSLGAELGELVGVALVQRHRGGEEFGGMVGLEPGGLIGDEA